MRIGGTTLEKIVLFGDSITAGYLNGYVSKALTDRLAERLPAAKIINVGIPGDTTNGGLERLQQHVLKKEPDLVTILFGSNDVTLAENISLTMYKKNMLTMIESIGAKKVLLITPSFSNPLVQHDERPNSRILAYGNAVRELAKEHHTLLADLQIAFLETQNYVDLLQADGFHLNEKGYDLLAKLIVDTVDSSK